MKSPLMSYSELVNLYFERSNSLQWYWTIYVVIIGGLLAFSSLRKQKDIISVALVTILFAFFAYKNCGAIHDVSEQRRAVLQSIKEFPVDSSDLNPARARIQETLVAPEWDGIRNFHIASDVITVLALWAMELRRRKSVPNGI